MKANSVRGVVLAVMLSLPLIALGALFLRSGFAPSPLNLLGAEIAFFTFLGTAIYARLRYADVEAPLGASRIRKTRSGFLALGSGYMLAIAASLWLIWGSLYVPPPLYYLALTAAILFVGLQIAYLPSTSRAWTVLVLVQIIGIGALIQVSFPWLNPKAVAADLYFNWLGIETIVQSGRIPEFLGFFFYFPSFHVLNAILVDVGGIELSSYTLFNHALVILAVPASFLLAREVLSPRKALTSALLLTVSLFFFLSTAVLPVLLGITLMLLVVYALLKYHRTMSRRWWATFWLLVPLVFFSHPVNALILGLILLVFWIGVRIHRQSSSNKVLALPTGTYLVAYVGYLAFIATNSFSIFLQSLFESGPRSYFARVVRAADVIPPSFTAQVIASTLGFAILFLPATVAMLSWLFKGNLRRRSFLGIVLVLAFVPALMVVLGRGEFGLQAARTLPYLSIFLVFPAASGLIYLMRRKRRGFAKIATFALTVSFVAFLSSTSYLTGSGNRFLSDTIPVQTTYVTDSMLAVGDFIDQLPQGTPLTLDSALAEFIAPLGSGLGYPLTPFPVDQVNTVRFLDGLGNASVALGLSDIYLSNRGYKAPDESSLDPLYAVRAYDNGVVVVYSPPGG